MGKSLPVINSQSTLPVQAAFSSNVTTFDSVPTGSENPYDGRTVDDFKPYLVALNLTSRCNLKCDHCYLDATTKLSGGSDELTTQECYTLIDHIAEVKRGC